MTNPIPNHRTPFKAKLPGSEIVNIHSELVTSPGLRKKLPEELFVAYFLPLFAGLETHPDVNIGRWVSIAGTPFAEVDIINTQGHTLYTVPPIFESKVIDTTKYAGGSIKAITGTYELLLRQSPHRAEAFMTHSLDKIDKTNDLSKWYNVHGVKMLPIFERYGVTPSWGATTNSPVPESAKPDYRPPVTDEEPL